LIYNVKHFYQERTETIGPIEPYKLFRIPGLFKFNWSWIFKSQKINH
jgi:hypothetical protein